MGKILIKNKKNQFILGENQETQKKGKSPEEEVSGSDQSTSVDRESTGSTLLAQVGTNLRYVRTFSKSFNSF